MWIDLGLGTNLFKPTTAVLLLVLPQFGVHPNPLTGTFVLCVLTRAFRPKFGFRSGAAGLVVLREDYRCLHFLS